MRLVVQPPSFRDRGVCRVRGRGPCGGANGPCERSDIRPAAKSVAGAEVGTRAVPVAIRRQDADDGTRPFGSDAGIETLVLKRYSRCGASQRHGHRAQRCFFHDAFPSEICAFLRGEKLEGCMPPSIIEPGELDPRRIYLCSVKSPHRTPRVGLSPMTTAATPVSAATEQEYQHNDNQDQFHRISPLMAAAISRPAQ